MVRQARPAIRAFGDGTRNRPDLQRQPLGWDFERVKHLLSTARARSIGGDPQGSGHVEEEGLPADRVAPETRTPPTPAPWKTEEGPYASRGGHAYQDTVSQPAFFYKMQAIRARTGPEKQDRASRSHETLGLSDRTMLFGVLSEVQGGIHYPGKVACMIREVFSQPVRVSAMGESPRSTVKKSDPRGPAILGGEGCLVPAAAEPGSIDSGQSVADGVLGQLGHAAHLELGHDRVPVGVDGLGGDPELVGDLLGG